MKKETSIEKTESVYNVSCVLKNTGIVYSINGKDSCLVNMKTHEMIGEFDKYETTYYSDTLYFFQCIKRKNSENKEIYYVNIYDAQNEKYLAKNYIRCTYSYTYDIYQDPETGKFHLFDMKAERKGTGIFSEAFDSIKTILSEYYGTFTVVEKDGKKGIYIGKKDKNSIKVEYPIEYDNIYKINSEDIIVFEKDGEAFFSFYDVSDGMIKSPKFKSIKCDKDNKCIIYCETETEIVVYDTSDRNRRLLCRFPKVEELKYLREESGRNYVFLFKEKGKYGLYGFHDRNQNFKDKETPLLIKLLDAKYDKIEEKSGNYYLYKGNKKGLYSIMYRDLQTAAFIEAEYDNIETHCGLYLLFNNGLCDIVSLDKINSPYVKNCEYLTCYDDAIIFKKFGQKGLVITEHSDVIVKSNLDNVEYKGRFDYKNLFLLEQFGRQSLIHGKNELVPPNYKSITLHGDNIKNLSYGDYCYMALKNKKVKLARVYRKKWYDPLDLRIADPDYENIEFFEDIYVTYDGEKKTVYNYHELPLKVFDGNVSIKSKTIKRRGRDLRVYLVDGIYYLYEGKNFEPAFIENHDLYKTTYESDTDFYNVESYIKEEYDKFCEYIDSLSDKEALKALEDALNESNDLRRKYPSLTLKHVSKRKDME